MQCFLWKIIICPTNSVCFSNASQSDSPEFINCSGRGFPFLGNWTCRWDEIIVDIQIVWRSGWCIQQMTKKRLWASVKYSIYRNCYGSMKTGRCFSSRFFFWDASSSVPHYLLSFQQSAVQNSSLPHSAKVRARGPFHPGEGRARDPSTSRGQWGLWEPLAQQTGLTLQSPPHPGAGFPEQFVRPKFSFFPSLLGIQAHPTDSQRQAASLSGVEVGEKVLYPRLPIRWMRDLDASLNLSP